MMLIARPVLPQPKSPKRYRPCSPLCLLLKLAQRAIAAWSTSPGVELKFHSFARCGILASEKRRATLAENACAEALSEHVGHGKMCCFHPVSMPKLRSRTHPCIFGSVISILQVGQVYAIN